MHFEGMQVFGKTGNDSARECPSLVIVVRHHQYQLDIVNKFVAGNAFCNVHLSNRELFCVLLN